MSPVRTCVIGVGRLGSEHARILSELPEAELVGVHDVAVSRGEEAAERLGTRHFADPAELFRLAETAVVAVPTVEHHETAARVLRAGLHALVEKPLAATVEEADELIELASSRALLLGVGHVERFNPVLRACAPHLRRPRYVESLRLSRFQPRGTDVTVVLDLMIHDIDLILGLLREPVVETRAVGVSVLSGSVDIANARLIFEGGAVASVTASRVSTDRRRQLRVFQRSGYFSLDLDAGRGTYLRRRDAGRSAGTAMAIEQLVERLPLAGDGMEPLRLELVSFLRAVRGERTGLVSAAEGRAALEVALRITRQIGEFQDVVAEDP